MTTTERLAMEAEAERLARDLGGGWRFEQSVMPQIVLTLPEARTVQDRIKQKVMEHETKTTTRSGAALRALADQLEAMPEDSGTLAAINHTLSTIGSETTPDSHRILTLLLSPEVDDD